MLKIACCGTHGAGKSTLVYQLADYFKRHKRNVYVIHERVRESPFPINSDMCEKTALWSFSSQVAKELNAMQNGYDTIVCDRSCFDTFIYSDFFHLNENPMQYFRIAAEEWIESYDYFFFVRPDIAPLEDGTRDIDNVFQIAIDRLFDDFFSHVDEKFYSEVFTSQIINKELDFNGFFRNT